MTVECDGELGLITVSVYEWERFPDASYEVEIYPWDVVAGSARGGLSPEVPFVYEAPVDGTYLVSVLWDGPNAGYLIADDPALVDCAPDQATTTTTTTPAAPPETEVQAVVAQPTFPG